MPDGRRTQRLGVADAVISQRIQVGSLDQGRRETRQVPEDRRQDRAGGIRPLRQVVAPKAWMLARVRMGALACSSIDGDASVMSTAG